MSRRKDDPVTWGDLLAITERLARVENEVSWLKESLKDVRAVLDGIAASLNRYKWWILSSVLSVWLLTILTRLLLG